jgi:hypothetical protein
MSRKKRKQSVEEFGGGEWPMMLLLLHSNFSRGYICVPILGKLKKLNEYQ